MEKAGSIKASIHSPTAWPVTGALRRRQQPIFGSVFLDFDVVVHFSGQWVFGSAPGTAGAGDPASAENLENLRQLNQLSAGHRGKTGHPEIIARIDGSYDGGGVGRSAQ